MDSNKLLKMKESILELEKMKNQLDGEIDSLLKTLKREHNVDSQDAAQKLLIDLDNSLTKQKDELTKNTIKLEKEYEWD